MRPNCTIIRSSTVTAEDQRGGCPLSARDSIAWLAARQLARGVYTERLVNHPESLVKMFAVQSVFFACEWGQRGTSLAAP